MNNKINKNIAFLIVGDLVLFYLALYIALALRSWDFNDLHFAEHYTAFLPLFVLYELVLFTSGIMDRKFVPSPKKIFDLLLPAHIIATLLMGLYFYVTVTSGYFEIEPRTFLLMFSVILFGLIYGWKVTRYKYFKGKPVRALLIGEDAEVEARCGQENLWDMQIVQKIPLHTDINTIESAINKKNVDAIIVPLDEFTETEALYKLIFKNVTILDLKIIKEEMTERIDLNRVDDLWFLRNVRSQEDILSSIIKRGFDLFLAVPVFIVYLLALPILSILIKKDGGDVFFEMPRVGKGGKIFTIKKFRSMSPDKKGKKELVGHEKKVTRIGAIMRKTGLDELPQVMSVVRGDMSFIGPRPEIPSLVEKYENEIAHYQMRHLVKPGLSGWAQVMQEQAPHHNIDIELTKDKLAYDLYYIKNHSVFLYIIIVLKTAKSLLNRTNHG